jgi:hypothetical protein
MATKLPYMVGPAVLPKILGNLKEAYTPERFTREFLSTKLGFSGNNHRQFIPLATKIGFLTSEGEPTDIYRQFRNPAQSRAAIARAVRVGYRELFERNSDAAGLSKDQLKALVIDITALDPSARVVHMICQTFDELRKLADFNGESTEDASNGTSEAEAAEAIRAMSAQGAERDHVAPGVNLSYTINVVLPKSDDPAVFNAIFRALRDNLLRK